MSKFTHSILITGGTSGLGYYCALEIAQNHPNYLVVISSRSDAESAAETIKKKTKQNNVLFMPLDLSDRANVRQFAQNWEQSSKPPIKALVFNAGLQFPKGLHYSKEGVEMTFAVNHVGHALLFHLLSPYLAADARTVLVTSGGHDPAQKTGLPDAHYTTAEELAHPARGSEDQPGLLRYTTSKLVNIMWTYALARRIESSTQSKSKTVVAMNPGLMPGTGLARQYPAAIRFLWLKVMPRIVPLLRIIISPEVRRPEESGASLAWVAVGEKCKKENGVYYNGREQIKSSVESYDLEKQEELWKWTVDFVSENKEEQNTWATLP